MAVKVRRRRAGGMVVSVAGVVLALLLLLLASARPSGSQDRPLKELPPAPKPVPASAVALPAEFWLKPVAWIGKRSLPLASCKVTLAGFPATEFRHEGDGRTRVKVGEGKRGRMGASYRVEVAGSAKVCPGLEGAAVGARKIAGVAPGGELAVPVRRSDGRAFVGVLSWPLASQEDEGNWRAALKMLLETFDAGAQEGRYLWGAIYAPDGRKLVASAGADYTPLELDTFSRETKIRFKARGPALRYDTVVTRVLSDVADLEGNVDLLVVAMVDSSSDACGWSSPFASATAGAGRSALVRVAKAVPGQSKDPAARARLCELAKGQEHVGLAAEVAVDPATAGGAPDRLLREALEAAAKSLLEPVPPAPEKAPKAATEIESAKAPAEERKVASAKAAPIETPAAAEAYQDRYELPHGHRPLALAYLAAPFAESLAGPASTFRIGAVAPGTTLLVRFLKRADVDRPWEGIPLGLFKGDSGAASTRLTVAGSKLALGGSKALHPTLYAFVSEDRPVAGFRVVTFESDAGRRADEVFSVLSDTSFLLRGYLDAPNLGVVENVACVNKRSSPPSCEHGTGEVVEDPLSGGPALLMVARDGPPKWLTKVPTDICIESVQDAKALPKVAAPIGFGKHWDLPFSRQEQRWCVSITNLNYVTVRQDGIKIANEPPKKRLDSRLRKSAGAWTMRAAEPRKGPKGEWIQRIVLARP